MVRSLLSPGADSPLEESSPMAVQVPGAFRVKPGFERFGLGTGLAAIEPYKILPDSPDEGGPGEGPEIKP